MRLLAPCLGIAAALALGACGDKDPAGDSGAAGDDGGTGDGGTGDGGTGDGGDTGGGDTGASTADADGDGFETPEDCDDSDPRVHPGAFDFQNDAKDSDCDGEEPEQLWFHEADIAIQGAPDRGLDFTGAMAAACDLDEDGFDDLIVARPRAGDDLAGGVGIFFGAGHADWTGDMRLEDADRTVGLDATNLGWQVGCDDTDGDGHMDLIVQRAERQDSWSDPDSVFSIFLFRGDGTWASDRPLGDADRSWITDLGSDDGGIYFRALDVVDVDADGLADILLTMNSNSRTPDADGALWRITADATSTGGWLADDLHSKLEITDTTDDQAISGVAWTGDLTGDGMPELFIGEGGYEAPSDDEGWASGRVWLRSGWPEETESLATSALASMQGEDGTGLGWQGAFGDFDGDGYTDLLVSEYVRENGEHELAGALWFVSDAFTVLAPDLAAPADVAELSLVGTNDRAGLGDRLWPLGDLDGDGHDDALLHLHGAGEPGVGAVYVISGALVATGSALTAEEAALVTIASEEIDHLSEGDEVPDAVQADFDGDGRPDLVLTSAMGERGLEEGGEARGRASVWLSSQMGW